MSLIDVVRSMLGVVMSPLTNGWDGLIPDTTDLRDTVQDTLASATVGTVSSFWVEYWWVAVLIGFGCLISIILIRRAIVKKRRRRYRR